METRPEWSSTISSLAQRASGGLDITQDGNEIRVVINNLIIGTESFRWVDIT
jgi:hypothetical protein